MMREHGGYWSSGDTSDDADPGVSRDQVTGGISDTDVGVSKRLGDVSDMSDTEVVRGLDQIDIDIDFPDLKGHG